MSEQAPQIQQPEFQLATEAVDLQRQAMNDERAKATQEQLLNTDLADRGRLANNRHRAVEARVENAHAADQADEQAAVVAGQRGKTPGLDERLYYDKQEIKKAARLNNGGGEDGSNEGKVESLTSEVAGYKSAPIVTETEQARIKKKEDRAEALGVASAPAAESVVAVAPSAEAAEIPKSKIVDALDSFLGIVDQYKSGEGKISRELIETREANIYRAIDQVAAAEGWDPALKNKLLAAYGDAVAGVFDRLEGRTAPAPEVKPPRQGFAEARRDFEATIAAYQARELGKEGADILMDSMKGLELEFNRVAEQEGWYDTENGRALIDRYRSWVNGRLSNLDRPNAEKGEQQRTDTRSQGQDKITEPVDLAAHRRERRRRKAASTVAALAGAALMSTGYLMIPATTSPRRRS